MPEGWMAPSLAGRYVLATSLTPDQADTARVVAYYHQLAAVEARFRVLRLRIG